MINGKPTILAAIAVVLMSAALPAQAFGFKRAVKDIESISKEIQNTNSYEIPAKGKLEVAFSPNEGSENLVKKVIQSASKELLILSYSFTSAPITKALVDAAHRGVTIHLVADYRNNITEDKSGKARAALSTLKNAGVDVRTIRTYPIHHDKVIIADRQTVELGSFNYSDAAANRNSENVLVNWSNPDLASTYIQHFHRNYQQSEVFATDY